MKKQIIMKQEQKTIAETFNEFLLYKAACGLSDKTLKTYRTHFSSICHHLKSSYPISELDKVSLNKMVESMRVSGLSDTSMNSYTKTLKSFLSWCNQEGYTEINIQAYKCAEKAIEVYTDEELALLLKKPNKRSCSFTEYRDWVIVNFLLNSGCRSNTLRNILIEDVNLNDKYVIFNTTKNKKVQLSPLCDDMVLILREYIKIRDGKEKDFLFPNVYGEQLSENALKLTMRKYNKRRGVEKTGVHRFRHTFAKKYLIDCGGNALMLKKLLGHSTLAMTNHYCNIYDADMLKNYDNFSPLANIKHNKTAIKMR